MVTRDEDVKSTGNSGTMQPLSALWRTISQYSVLRFIGHFLEMVLAMLPGMMIYHVIKPSLLASGSLLAWPTVRYALFALLMTAPMAAWMIFRRHSYRQTIEMSAAMILPMIMLVPIGLTEYGCLAMTLGMLSLMLYRYDEYAHGTCHNEDPGH